MKGFRKDPEGTEVRVFVRHVPLADAQVLEIGCGDGRFTRRIAGIARSVLGIDPDAESIARARQLTPARLSTKVRYTVGDVEKLHLRAQSFDVALLGGSL